MNPELDILLSIGTFLGSIATIIVAGLIWKQSRQTQTALNHTEKAHFATLLRDLFHENSMLLREEISLEKVKWKDSLDACEIYALTYCDFMNQVAYLAVNEKIPPDVAKRFTEYFEYVHLIMDWYNKVIQILQSNRTLRPSSERWPVIFEYVKKIDDFKRDNEKSYLPTTMYVFSKWADESPDSLKDAMKNPTTDESQQQYDVFKNGGLAFTHDNKRSY